MRDPERCPRIAAKLAKLWSRHPSIRMGQLLTSITNDTSQHPNPEWPDQFYLEDGDLETRLDIALAEGISYFSS